MKQHDTSPDSSQAFEQALAKSQDSLHVLRLFVTGTTPASLRAIANLKAICNERLKDHYELEVIDLYQQPNLARGENILVTPTLIKHLPPPFRRIIGDLSNKEKVLAGLDLQRKPVSS